jgi:hypothetical protein
MHASVVTIEEQGRVWIGRYWVRDGVLIVTAAYGERRAVATRNRTKLHSQAEELLGRLARQSTAASAAAEGQRIGVQETGVRQSFS